MDNYFYGVVQAFYLGFASRYLFSMRKKNRSF